MYEKLYRQLEGRLVEFDSSFGGRGIIHSGKCYWMPNSRVFSYREGVRYLCVELIPCGKREALNIRPLKNPSKIEKAIERAFKGNKRITINVPIVLSEEYGKFCREERKKGRL